MMKKRILLYDIARVLCVLWIVAFWHMIDYFKLTEAFSDYGFITVGVLSCFTFLSGLFLGKKRMGIKDFYVARFRRFWFLLLFSAISFYAVGYIDNLSSFIGTITGLSCFGLSWARTLWYFSMLIFFYLLTPFLRGAKFEMKNVVIKGVFVYITLISMSYITPPIHWIE